MGVYQSYITCSIQPEPDGQADLRCKVVIIKNAMTNKYFIILLLNLLITLSFPHFFFAKRKITTCGNLFKSKLGYKAVQDTTSGSCL